MFRVVTNEPRLSGRFVAIAKRILDGAKFSLFLPQNRAKALAP